MSETCWAHNKWNKKASDIKLVFHSLTNVAYVFVLLSSIRCNYVVMCCVGGTCGQRPSFVRRYLFRFRTVPLVGPLLLGGGGPKKISLVPETALAGPAFCMDKLFITNMSYLIRLAMKNVTMPYS